MPFSKTDLFNEAEMKLANIGRALSHPARIRIFKLLNENGWAKNVELSSKLELTPTSVSNHVRKLKEAGLVQINYKPNYYEISLVKEGLNDISAFAEEFS